MCSNFILPETGKPCLLFYLFQFAQFIVPYLDNTSYANNEAVTNGDAKAHDHICAEPAVISDVYGTCVAEVTGYAMLIFDCPALMGNQRMKRCHDSYVRPKLQLFPIKVRRPVR